MIINTLRIINTGIDVTVSVIRIIRNVFVIALVITVTVITIIVVIVLTLIIVVMIIVATVCGVFLPIHCQGGCSRFSLYQSRG